MNRDCRAAMSMQRLAQAHRDDGLAVAVDQNRYSPLRGSRSISFIASADSGTRCSRDVSSATAVRSSLGLQIELVPLAPRDS